MGLRLWGDELRNQGRAASGDSRTGRAPRWGRMCWRQRISAAARVNQATARLGEPNLLPIGIPTSW
jgi:hypothetical protein